VERGEREQKGREGRKKEERTGKSRRDLLLKEEDKCRERSGNRGKGKGGKEKSRQGGQ